LSIVPTGEEGDKKRAEKLKEKYEQIYEEGIL
jgi:hypothetical protein